MKAGIEISHMSPSGLVFADGTRVTADLIVFATGFDFQINLIYSCLHVIQIQEYYDQGSLREPTWTRYCRVCE